MNDFLKALGNVLMTATLTGLSAFGASHYAAPNQGLEGPATAGIVAFLGSIIQHLRANPFPTATPMVPPATPSNGLYPYNPADPK
jgi:hypothetical protein